MVLLQIERSPRETSTTLLAYDVAPTQVPTGSTAELAFAAINRGTSPVTFTRANSDSVTITLPATLTTALSAVGYRSLSPDWGINALSGSPGSFLVRPLLASVTLAPGQGFGVQLNNIQVDGKTGTTADVEIDESVGDAYGSTELPVTIGGPQLSISALASPTTVTLNQPSTIAFTAIGGAYVELMPGGQRQTCTGDVYQGLFQVVPQPPSTQYTLTVYDNASGHASTDVTVQVGRVAVLDFGPAGLDVGFDDTVTLTWRSQYATRATLTPQTITQVPVQGSRAVQPGQLAPDNASEITFTLTLQGYGGPVQRQLPVRLKPMSILYFGLPPDSAFAQFQILNGRGAAEQNPPPLPPQPPLIWRLTATGPGGPEVRYIGPGPWLECQYFVVDNQTVPPGAKVTFSWQTLNATTAKLNGQAVPLRLDGTTGTGSTQVTVDRTTTYVLVVGDAKGNTQSNQITVTVAQ
ncbi:hypothetical protein HT746_32560 [Burkholderia pyrrocinia]|uniref:hypothetical protein n=1 Tax=Burkholderia pyrrocinia TaxID=60550 RepID=UPI0015756C00|nr:hypothetical protein [Burkholderia pyrrocinia]NTX31789.1 hypothetical protein [Burkholderia pyrrocinia]